MSEGLNPEQMDKRIHAEDGGTEKRLVAVGKASVHLTVAPQIDIRPGAEDLSISKNLVIYGILDLEQVQSEKTHGYAALPLAVRDICLITGCLYPGFGLKINKPGLI